MRFCVALWIWYFVDLPSSFLRLVSLFFRELKCEPKGGFMSALVTTLNFLLAVQLEQKITVVQLHLNPLLPFYSWAAWGWESAFSSLQTPFKKPARCNERGEETAYLKRWPYQNLVQYTKADPGYGSRRLITGLAKSHQARAEEKSVGSFLYSGTLPAFAASLRSWN